MAPTANTIPGLVTDPSLHQAWRDAVPGTRLAAIAGAVAGGRGSVIVASPTPVDGAAPMAAAPGLAAALGVRSVEVVVVTAAELSQLVRDWAYQAGQGSGRGVHVTVRVGGDGANGSGGPDGGRPDPVRVLVRAIDSSARELALRLASPTEPALAALRALLGGREVTVEDEEDLPT